MVMKNSLLFSIIAIMLSACGGKKPVNTSFTLTAGALLSGAPANGGVAVIGTNGTDKFSVGLTAAQAQNFSLELNPGDWTFHAVAWLGSASGPMTGETRCGSGSGTVEGTNVNISITLNGPTCDSPTFSSAATQDTGESFPTFKKITLNSCLNPLGAFSPTDDCDSTLMHLYPGESVSAKLMIPGFSNFGATLPSLQSNCINLVGLGSSPPNFSSGVMMSDVRLPAGGSAIFPAAIIGFENGNCTEETNIYAMPDGVTGSQGVGRILETGNGTRLKISFADNYFGVIGSPFYEGHQTNHVKVPNVKCNTSNCYNINSSSRADYSNGRDPARDAVWNILGSPNKLSSHDWGWSGFAVGGTGITTDTGPASLTITSMIDGAEVSGQIQSDATNGATCTGGSDNIHIEVKVNGTNTSPATIATTIMSEPSCIGLVSASSTDAPPTPTTHTWSFGGLSFSGLTPVLNRVRRDSGALHDVRDMLLGPIGAILHKNGIQTGLALCSAVGSFSADVRGELITIAIMDATTNADTADFSNVVADYERKVLISSDGVPEEAFYFNCDSAGADANKIYDGAYVGIYNEDSGGTNKVQLFWNTNRPTNMAMVELTTEHTGSQDHRSHTLFSVDTSVASSWNVWHVNGSTTHDHYTSLVAVANGGVVNVGYVSTNDESNTEIPVHDGTTYNDVAFTMSTGLGTTVTANTQDIATVYGGSLSTTVVGTRDIMGVMGSLNFWDLSY